MSFPKSTLPFAGLTLTLAILGACSTTTVEAPPPAPVTIVTPAPSVAMPRTPGTIVAVATASGQFNTLIAAASAAGLGGTLIGPGPFTVFAPTDQAFSNLPSGTVERLLRPENREALRKIVSYHVVRGNIRASSLMGTTSMPPTLEGMSLNIDGRNGVRVNGAMVIQPDIEASNGVIHSIDTVLMPADLPTIR
jgi:uncharacterized surface protein with fasciclin (FAS1) repeats